MFWAVLDVLCEHVFRWRISCCICTFSEIKTDCWLFIFPTEPTWFCLPEV